MKEDASITLSPASTSYTVTDLPYPRADAKADSPRLVPHALPPDYCISAQQKLGNCMAGTGWVRPGRRII